MMQRCPCGNVKMEGTLWTVKRITMDDTTEDESMNSHAKKKIVLHSHYGPYKAKMAMISRNVNLMRVLMAILCLSSLTASVEAETAGITRWKPRKGCHKVGHRRTISLPGCDRIEVLLNGCRGQCLSWAIPSTQNMLASSKFRHKVTSFSHCCRMMEHEEVTYLIKCEEGLRELQFPSALKCDCFDCTHHSLK